MGTRNAGLADMVSANGGAQQDGGHGLNSKFRVVKKLEAEMRPSLKNLAPHTKSVREFGVSTDMGSKIGMTKINTAESTKIQAPPEIGKGSIFNIVF